MLRCHWTSEKYGAGNLRFPHTKEFFQKFSVLWECTHLEDFASSDLYWKCLRNITLKGTKLLAWPSHPHVIGWPSIPSSTNCKDKYSHTSHPPIYLPSSHVQGQLYLYRVTEIIQEHTLNCNFVRVWNKLLCNIVDWVLCMTVKYWHCNLFVIMLFKSQDYFWGFSHFYSKERHEYIVCICTHTSKSKTWYRVSLLIFFFPKFQITLLNVDPKWT